MAQSLANFDAALKDDYGPGLRNAINSNNPILTEATRNDEDIVGRKAVWSVHTGRSSSTSARGELGSLHTADRQRFSSMNEDLAYLYHTIKVSGQAKHLTQNDRGAFARAMDTELKGAERDLKNDVSRQVFGQYKAISTTNYTGVIATLSADPGTGTTLTFANEPTSVLRHFFADMVIQAINPSTGAVRSGGPYTVLSVDSSAKTVTIDAAADASIGSADWIVRSGTEGTPVAKTNFGNEINGLRALISATTVFAGVDPASVPAWASLTAGSSTTGISEVVLDQAAEAVETDGDGSSPNLYITEHAQRRKLASQLQAQKRYDGKQTTLEAGWEGLQIARGTLVVDRYCPSNAVFGITTAEFVRFVGLDWSWDDDDDRILNKATDGSDAVEARFKTYMNLVTTNRNSHVLVTLAEPTF